MYASNQVNKHAETSLQTSTRSRLIASTSLALLLALSACGEQLSTEEYLQRAENYRSEGNYPSAIIEARNAVKGNAGDASARLALGQTYFEVGNFVQADKELTRALELGADPEQVLPSLARSLSFLGEHERLMGLPIETLESSTGRADGMTAKALTSLRRGETLKAEILIGEALKDAPTSVYALLAQAQLLTAKGEEKAAQSILNQVLEIAPDHAGAWRFLGETELRRERMEEAEKAFTRAIELAPTGDDDRFKRALIRIARENYAGAAEDTAVLEEKHPNSPGVAYLKGVSLLNQDKLEEARDPLESASQGGPTAPMALYYLALISAQDGQLLEAQNYLAQLTQLAPRHLQGSKLSAFISLELKDFSAAEAIMQPIVADSPEDTQSLNLLANALMSQGKTGEALGVLTSVAELQPESAEAQGRLGWGEVVAGKGLAGVGRLERALKLDEHYQQAQVLLVLSYLRKEDFDSAMKAAQHYLSTNPDEASSYNILGRVHAASGNTEGAKEAYRKAASLNAGNTTALFALADMAELESDTVEAKRLYLEVLEHHPDDFSSLMRLSIIDARQGDEDAMVERLNNAIKARPDAWEPRAILAKYYLANGEVDRANALVADLSGITKRQPRVARALAEIELAQNDYRGARFHLENVVAARPNSSADHFQLAMAYAGMGDSSKTRAALETTLQIDGGHLPARIALARLLLIQKELPELKRQVDELERRAPENFDTQQLLKQLASLEKDPEQAMADYQTAFNVRQDTESLLNLVRFQHTQGEVDAATGTLHEWLKEHEEDNEARMTLAEIYLRAGEIPKATEQFEAVVAVNGQHLAAINNLAWYLLESNPEKALRYALRAAELDPNSPEVLDTLAMTLMASGDPAEARNPMATALALRPHEPALRYHDALIKAANGDNIDAIIALRALLGPDTDFPDRPAAQAKLESLESEL